MATVQLPGSKGHDKNMVINSTTSSADVSSDQELQKHDVIDQVKYKNGQIKNVDRILVSCAEFC